MKKKVQRGSSPGVQDLHPARLLGLCETKHLARRIVLFESVASTNAAAMAAADAGAPDGTLFIAHEQTLGKGRRGRSWFSSKGTSLTFSLLLRPRRAEEGLTAICALAVVRALGALVKGLAIKWPNDVFLKGRKLGGILAESRDGVVVIGLGLNINEGTADFPRDIAGEAISMRIGARKTFDRGIVLCRILVEFEGLCDRFVRDGFAPFRGDIERYLLYTGKRVVIESGGDAFGGRMLGITNDGYLCLEIDGAERIFSSGDLTLRERPPRT